MTTSDEDTSIRLEVAVAVPVEQAFRVFTENFDRIKPREHNLLAAPIAETVLEPHLGGSVYDRAEDGTVCRWARVLVFEPPNRFVISWGVSPLWQLETDADRTSEVEVRFIQESPSRTRVELEHRHLDYHGDGWERGRDALGSDGGWPLYLHRFSELSTES